MGLANVAASIHANMCEDPGFGYSWGERYGTSADPVTWNIEGRNYVINRGDYDCSSSVITAWQTALEGTPYEGALDGATYTGNMRSVFVNSGLFEVWDVNNSSAVRGDVYLNDDSHTAMCQDGGDDGVFGYDALSEFSINENGEVYGGQRGDQNNWESHITGYYNYPWYCILHYNGKADGTAKPVRTGWIQDEKGWWYGYSNGSWAADKWEKINGKWYLFDKDGYMLSGWQQWEGYWYYLQPKTDTTGDSYGYLLTGWQKIKWKGQEYKFFFKKTDPKMGSMCQDGFYKISNKWYYFDKDGCLVSNPERLKMNKTTGAITVS